MNETSNDFLPENPDEGRLGGVDGAGHAADHRYGLLVVSDERPKNVRFRSIRKQVGKNIDILLVKLRKHQLI